MSLHQKINDQASEFEQLKRMCQNQFNSFQSINSEMKQITTKQAEDITQLKAALQEQSQVIVNLENFLSKLENRISSIRFV